MTDIWDVLFELAPIRRPKPLSTLYDVIVDTKDLETVKRFVAGGHSVVEQFAGGDSVSLAIAKGDREFVQYFVEAAPDIKDINEIVTQAVRRYTESNEAQFDVASGILDYVLEQPLAENQLTSGYLFCATTGVFSAAQKIIDAGLQDHEIRVGANEYQLLSERVAALGNSEFAALLKGEAVDTDSLVRAENKERKLAARLKGALDDLEPFAEQQVLVGSAFDTSYQSLLREVEAGDRDEQLESHDSRFGRSVLEFAAENGFVDLVEVILNRIKDAPDNSVAIAAATYGHLDVIKVLKAQGVAVEQTPAGKNTALSEACRYGHYDVVCYLLEQGADPASGDGSGHDLSLADITGGEQRSKILAALDDN